LSPVWVPALRSGTAHRIASGTRDDRTSIQNNATSARTSEANGSRECAPDDRLRRARSGTHNHRYWRWVRSEPQLAQQRRPVVMGPRSSAQLRTRRRRQRKAVALRSNCSSLDSFSPRPGDLPVVPICRSSATLRASPNQRHLPPVPPRFKRGVSRSSRTLGSGMRWTLAVCRRTHLRSGRRSRVVLTPQWLASSRRSYPPATVTTKPDHRGEREGNR